MDCGNKLSKQIFDDSRTAKQMQRGRTKAEAIIIGVLSSESVRHIQQDLNVSTNFSSHRCLPYSVSSDASNHGNIKMFPLIVQYFTPKTGINVKLLDFYEDPKETSDDIMSAIKVKLDKHNLPLECVSAYSADNASVNFENHHSVFTLMKEQCSYFIQAGCKAHIIHNAVKHTANKLDHVDIESLVIRVYNHFSSRAKRTLALKEMYEFVELEWSELLRHVPTRWLSLEPAVKRLETNWTALYSSFQSIDDCPVAIQRLMQVDRDGGADNFIVRCYLGFIENVSNVFHESVLVIEKKACTITEVYGIMHNLLTKLQNRKEHSFFGTATQDLLDALETDEQDSAVCDFNQFLDTAVAYLNKWFHFSDDGFYHQMIAFSLDKGFLKFDELKQVIKGNKYLHHDIFDEFCLLKKRMKPAIST